VDLAGNRYQQTREQQNPRKTAQAAETHVNTLINFDLHARRGNPD
jgi:hypothetical protein